MIRKKILGVIAIVLAFVFHGTAQNLILPDVIGNNMIIQRDKPVRIFGKAKSCENVSVSFGSQQQSGISDGTGAFLITLNAEAASSVPRDMTISSDGETITLQNILVGDVFLCSGQSNMAFQVQSLPQAMRTEIASDADYPDVRYYWVAKYRANQSPDTPWTAFNASSVPTLSAIGFYFARQLYKDKNIPIGVIDCSQGSSNADSWIDLAYYDAHPELIPYRVGFTTSEDYKYFANPGGLYTNMLSRVVPYTLAGFLWYQGEANSGSYYNYAKIFPGLIDCFRERFLDNTLPFVFAQLAAYSSPTFWPPVREVQDSVARTIAHTAMISTIDVGAEFDIHPTNKKTPGERFALAIRKLVYGDNVVHSGPSYKSIRFEGKKAIISFDFAAGLKTTSVLTRELEICGDNYCYAAATDAEIINDELYVWNDEINDPKAVRYAWKSFPLPNLYNAADLPANPFRTSAQGATAIYVSPTGNDQAAGTASTPLRTIAQALNMLSDFQETTIILEKDAVFEEKGLTIDRNKIATIIGDNTTIQAASTKQSPSADRILWIDLYSTLKLKNIILKNGYRASGADNPAKSGGAIYFGGFSLEIDSCKFIDNVASAHGGAIAGYGNNVMINHSYFEGSISMDGYGGAIAQNGITDQSNSLSIYNSTFSKNKTLSTTANLGTGSAIRAHSATVTITNSCFVENTCALQYQAALDLAAGTAATMYITNNTFFKNTDASVNVDGFNNRVFFSNNAIAGGVYGLRSGYKVEPDRRKYAIEGYNNVIYSTSGALGGSINDASFRENRAACNNQIVDYSSGVLSLNSALTSDGTFVPYLSITSESSSLVNKCTHELSYSTGTYNIPQSDIRGLRAVGIRDIGAYEYGATETGLKHPVLRPVARIYPNPVTNVLSVSTNLLPSKMEIYSSVGNRIDERPFSSQISVQNLTNGVYFLILTDQQGNRETAKFIKK